MKRLFVLSVGLILLGAGCTAKYAAAPAAQDNATATSVQPAVTTSTATQPAEATTTKADAPAQVPAKAVNVIKKKTTAPQVANGYVTVKDFIFSPQMLVVNVGATITWTNKGASNHTVDSDAPLIFNSGNIAPGSSYKHTFDSPGTYAYHCSVHSAMTGTIIVR
jgi:plastocyanin